MSILRRTILVSMVMLLPFAGKTQNFDSPEIRQMYQQARNYLATGNFRQAIAVYQQAIRLSPETMELYRDLGQAYYLSGDYKMAEETMNAIIKNGKADETCYQVASASLAARQEYKKARAALTKGLEQFPSSGLLYHELGSQYEAQEEKEEALKAWLTGIQKAPAYHINYFEAAHIYVFTSKVIWAIIYAEMFINIEQQTPRAHEARRMLFAAYKRLFFTPSGKEAPLFGSGSKNEQAHSFEEAVTGTYMKLAPVVSDGISTENLIMLRTRFIMEWRVHYAARYPFELFSRMDQLLRDGEFDAYNQWLFGKTEDADQYNAWNKFNTGKIAELEEWLRQNPFKPNTGSFYNDMKIKGLIPKKK